MSLNKILLAELTEEAATTKKILEKVPMEKFDWKPHDKSFSLGVLAGHITELPSWVAATVNEDQLDFAVTKYTPPKISNSSELMQAFNGQLEKAKAVLQQNIKDEDLMKNWTLRNGDNIFFTMPKINVLRTMVLNHIIHHRAQLGVYLRLLGVALPSSYGPTADNPMM